MGTGRTAAHTFLSDPRRVATANLSRQVWPTVGCGPGLVCSAIASEGGSRCNAAHAGHGDALWRGCAAEGRLCREAKGTQRSRCRPVRSAESARNSPALSNTLRIRRGRCFGEGHGCGNGMRCASRGAWRGRGGGKRVARRRGDAFEKARRFAHASVVVIERGAHPRIPTQLGIQPGPPELPPSTARCPGHRAIASRSSAKLEAPMRRDRRVWPCCHARPRRPCAATRCQSPLFNGRNVSR
ncbi:hypothetical protein ERJ75_000644900 [Trypanosoma vivax]|nr:hypothetical protein ERJ75_000644900 [Trypanosoma vivax]